MTMPSGTKVTTAYDFMGVPNTVSGQAAAAPSATSYAYGVNHTPAGVIQQVLLGNGLIEQTCYNDHQQPFAIRQRTGTIPTCQAGMTADGSDVAFFSIRFRRGTTGISVGSTFSMARAVLTGRRISSRPTHTTWR